MTWTAPMTATAKTILFASQWNTFVRDNLNATAPALATAAGQYFVSSRTDGNALIARSPSSATVLTSQTTASGSYTDLATVGPTVTITTGTKALVWWVCESSSDTVDTQTRASYSVTGASFDPAVDSRCILNDGKDIGGRLRGFGTFRHSKLTAGSNTFKMKYRVGGGTGTFLRRELVVFPLS